MARCYRMSLEEFTAAGLGWFVRTAHLEYKRPLGLGDNFIVRTWVEDMRKDGVRVQFDILKKPTASWSVTVNFDYTLVRLNTGRAEVIPAAIAEKYAI